MPAAMEMTRCRPASKPRNSAMTRSICCGLTARKSTSDSATTSAFCIVARPPVAAVKRSRASGRGSAASRPLAATNPARTNPCPRAVAICPAPIKPMDFVNIAVMLAQSRQGDKRRGGRMTEGDCPDFRAATRSVGPKMGLSPWLTQKSGQPRRKRRRTLAVSQPVGWAWPTLPFAAGGRKIPRGGRQQQDPAQGQHRQGEDR